MLLVHLMVQLQDLSDVIVKPLSIYFNRKAQYFEKEWHEFSWCFHPYQYPPTQSREASNYLQIKALFALYVRQNIEKFNELKKFKIVE